MVALTVPGQAYPANCTLKAGTPAVFASRTSDHLLRIRIPSSTRTAGTWTTLDSRGTPNVRNLPRLVACRTLNGKIAAVIVNRLQYKKKLDYYTFLTLICRFILSSTTRICMRKNLKLWRFLQTQQVSVS